MTTTVAEDLELEHRVIDNGIELFASGESSAPAPDRRAALLAAIATLRRHIYLEEEYLFPPLRAAGLVGPVMVMVHEHGQMWPILDKLERLLADDDTDTTTELCRNLLQQLASHNMKEERILYPQAQDVLPREDLDKLRDLLTGAELPSGWVCAGAV